MKKILHITPNFNYSCGRSKLVFLYLKYFGNNANYETHFITNGGDSLDRLKEVPQVKLQIFRFTTRYKNVVYKKSFYNSLKKYVDNRKIDAAKHRKAARSSTVNWTLAGCPGAKNSNWAAKESAVAIVRLAFLDIWCISIAQKSLFFY